MVIGAVLTIYSFYSQAIPGETLSTPVIEIGWAFCTINCVLLTAGTFLMFTCINSSKAPRIITEMSKLSYGMYLMHIFWLGLWATVFKYTLALPTVAAIPCIAVSTFICCFLTSKLISFIPGSKWIIGWTFEYGYFHKIGYAPYAIVPCRRFIFRHVQIWTWQNSL